MEIQESIIKNKYYAISFFSILGLGIFFRVFFTPWEIPFRSPDAFLFLLEAVEYSHGNFEYFNLRFFWPLLLSVVYSFSKFETFFELMTITRVITAIIASASIPIVYFISKQFTSKKFALLAMGIFATNPALIENASFSIREPLMIFFGLIGFYFIIKNNWKLSLIGFLFAGLAFDVKINGIIILFLAMISCLWIRPKTKATATMIIGLGIFLVISLPYIIYPIENQQIPFIMHVSESSRIVTESEVWPSTQVSGVKIDSNFILTYSLEREIIHVLKISLPFLIILAPIGLYFSIKNLNHKKIILLAGITITFLIAYPMYFQSAEFRNIIFAIPLLCILGSIGVESITKKIKKQETVILIILVIFSATSFIMINMNYSDTELILEKNDIAKLLINDFSGRFLGDLNNELVQNIPDVKRDRINGTNYGMHFNENISVTKAIVPINTEQSLMDLVTLLNVDYIIIDNFSDNRYPIFEKIFHNESEIESIKKVYDSENEFQKIRVKVFQSIKN